LKANKIYAGTLKSVAYTKDQDKRREEEKCK